MWHFTHLKISNLSKFLIQEFKNITYCAFFRLPKKFYKALSRSVYQRCPQTLVEICRNTDICDVLRAVARNIYVMWYICIYMRVSYYWTLNVLEFVVCHESMFTARRMAIITESGVGVTNPTSSIPLFFQFFMIVKNTLTVKYRVYIWQVSPQLCCGDTC